MDTSMTTEAGRLAFRDFDPGESAGCEQFKLDRLLELRAVIDSLRAERGVTPLNNAHTSQDWPLAV